MSDASCPFANTGNTVNTNTITKTKTKHNCKLVIFTFGLNDPPQLDSKSDTIEEGRGKPDDDNDDNYEGDVDTDDDGDDDDDDDDGEKHGDVGQIAKPIVCTRAALPPVNLSITALQMMDRPLQNTKETKIQLRTGRTGRCCD